MEEEPDTPWSGSCLNCNQHCTMVCGFCDEAPYCDDECEKANFELHKTSCTFKERNLMVQETCAVCDQALHEVEGDPLICTDCHGIVYCSVECQNKNKTEHKKFICKAYANLPPRPAMDHRLVLFFPSDESKPRFLWTPLDKASKTAITVPLSGNNYTIERGYYAFAGGAGQDLSVNEADYRNVLMYHNAAYLSVSFTRPNQSMGTATNNGQATRALKGNALLCAELWWGDGDDVVPSDLPKLVESSKRAEQGYRNSHSGPMFLPKSALHY